MPKWPSSKGRESENHFWGFPQIILFWSESVPNNSFNFKKKWFLEGPRTGLILPVLTEFVYFSIKRRIN
jgi:hypothetical protein